LFELESIVLHNKFQAYGQRSSIEENRQLILKNYEAAMGNRMLTNHNTDDIFKNRHEILSALKIGGSVQANLIGSKINEAKVDYLEHRSEMNSYVSAINDKMSQANSILIDVNTMIMDGNAQIVEFNSTHMKQNNELLSGAIHAEIEQATPESNAKRIMLNRQRMNGIVERALRNKSVLEETTDKVKINRGKLLQNSNLIYQRRERIEQDHGVLSERQAAIAELISRSGADDFSP
jgi:hypothetical protein